MVGTASEGKDIKIILFRVNEQLLGMKISYVREVLEYQEPTPVPDSPSWIAGVLDVGDRIIPVASLHCCLYGEEDSSGEGHLLSVKVDEREIAFTTDIVTAIKTVGSEQVTLPTDITADIHESLIEGIIRLDGRVAMLINPENAVDSTIMQEVMQATGEGRSA